MDSVASNTSKYWVNCEKILEIDARKMQLDVKFGGNKQDADSKIMKWILDSKRPGMDEFISTQ
jgi:hypothetical protein